MPLPEDGEALEGVEALEEEMGLPRGFLRRIAAETDWSFIVQLHALLESALSHTIVLHMGNDKLDAFVRRLDMGHKKRGKVALAVVYGLVGPEDCAFIAAVSEHRNRLVHDARHVNFKLADHYQELADAQIQSSFASWGFPQADQRGRLDVLQAFRRDPKTFFQLRAINLFYGLYLKGNIHRWLRATSSTIDDLVKEIVYSRLAKEQ